MMFPKRLRGTLLDFAPLTAGVLAVGGLIASLTAHNKHRIDELLSRENDSSASQPADRTLLDNILDLPIIVDALKEKNDE